MLASSPLAAARLLFVTWARLNPRSHSRVLPPMASSCIPHSEEKAAALGFSLILNHPFVDGNKRIGHAALEVFLVLNGFELRADVDDAEAMILGVAAGTVAREKFVLWIRAHLTAYPSL